MTGLWDSRILEVWPRAGASHFFFFFFLAVYSLLRFSLCVRIQDKDDDVDDEEIHASFLFLSF